MTTGSSEVVIEVTRSSEVAPPPPDSSTALNKRVACQPQTSAISVRSGPNEPTQLKSLPTSEVPTARHCLGISLPEAATLLFALVLFVTSLAFAIHADLDPSCADPTISPITCRHPRIAPVEVAQQRLIDGVDELQREFASEAEKAEAANGTESKPKPWAAAAR